MTVELPVGTQFYVGGHHYIVTGHGVRDGVDPAVYVRRLTAPPNGKKNVDIRIPFRVSYVLKFATIREEV